MKRRRRSHLGMWPVEHIPADLTSTWMGLREARTCKEAERYIDKGRAILRQLRRRRVRLPNAEMMAAWEKSVKSFKRTCRRK